VFSRTRFSFISWTCPKCEFEHHSRILLYKSKIVCCEDQIACIHGSPTQGGIRLGGKLIRSMDYGHEKYDKIRMLSVDETGAWVCVEVDLAWDDVTW
jgi:hypothetical protein